MPSELWAAVPLRTLQDHTLSARARILYALLIAYTPKPFNDPAQFPDMPRLAEEVGCEIYVLKMLLEALRERKMIDHTGIPLIPQERTDLDDPRPHQ